MAQVNEGYTHLDKAMTRLRHGRQVATDDLFQVFIEKTIMAWLWRSLAGHFMSINGLACRAVISTTCSWG